MPDLGHLIVTCILGRIECAIRLASQGQQIQLSI